jgi:beta-mannanase
LRRRVCAVFAAIAVAVALVPDALARPKGKLVPETGVYLGASVPGWDDRPYDNVRSFEQMIGRKLAIDHHYWGWRQRWPSDYERWDVRQGRIPMVSWVYQGSGKLRAITSGRWDRVIRRHARRVRRFGHPLFLRWGWEMNNDSAPWSGYQNGRDPEKFVRSWRRIVRIFRHVGARNAVFVWCPSRKSDPAVPWNAARHYYPGDRYVGWVCTEAYNWGTSRDWSSWHDFAWLAGPNYRRFADRKPMMIGESASAEQGGSKAAWILQAGDQMSSTFRNIAAYVWFNKVDQNVDWRVNSSQASVDAYRELGRRAYFSVMR